MGISLLSSDMDEVVSPFYPALDPRVFEGAERI